MSLTNLTTLATRLARSSDPDGTVTFLNRLEETSDVQRVLDEDLLAVGLRCRGGGAGTSGDGVSPASRLSI